MFKFLNRPIIKNTSITYGKLIYALIPTIIILFLMYPQKFKSSGFKIGIIMILSVLAAAVISIAIQLLSKYIIDKKLKR